MPASRSHPQPSPGRIPDGATAAEKRWLNEEGLAEKEKRRRARVLRNRLSAQNSRNRRKTHLQELEETVEHLRRENDILRAGGTVDPSEGGRIERRLGSYDDDEDAEEDNEDDEDDYEPTPRDLGRRASGNTINQVDKVVSAPSSTFSGWENEKPTTSALVEENAVLKKRVAELENIIRNMPVSQVTPQPTFSINGQLVVPDLKIPSFVTSPSSSTVQIALPLSPTSLSTPLTLPTHNVNLTCHPAAMATLLASSEEAGKALQRVSLMVRVGEKVEEWTLDVAIK